MTKVIKPHLYSNKFRMCNLNIEYRTFNSITIDNYNTDFNFTFHHIQDGVNEVDPCLSAPCANGGSCLPHLGRFDCICATHYTGVQCEESKCLYVFTLPVFSPYMLRLLFVNFVFLHGHSLFFIV